MVDQCEIYDLLVVLKRRNPNFDLTEYREQNCNKLVLRSECGIIKLKMIHEFWNSPELRHQDSLIIELSCTYPSKMTSFCCKVDREKYSYAYRIYVNDKERSFNTSLVAYDKQDRIYAERTRAFKQSPTVENLDVYKRIEGDIAQVFKFYDDNEIFAYYNTVYDTWYDNNEQTRIHRFYNFIDLNRGFYKDLMREAIKEKNLYIT